MLKIENFSKSYGKTEAVKQLNLTVKKGEIVGFVGKNGAGKSTTIRAMLNLIKPTTGRILINGLEASTHEKEIKQQLGYMPSESVFPASLTGAQVLTLCLNFSSQTMEEMQQLATYFELDLTKKIGDLSLGNRKKVSIIQALLKKPSLLVLDEPTNGLDPLMQHKFFELLLHEKAKGVTIFLSSHNLSEIEKYCDKVAIIKDGELVDYLEMSAVKVAQKQIVTYTTVEGVTQQLTFDGDINTLIANLSTLNLTSLEIKNTTVEDEFIQYYTEGN